MDSEHQPPVKNDHHFLVPRMVEVQKFDCVLNIEIQVEWHFMANIQHSKIGYTIKQKHLFSLMFFI